MSRKSTWSKEEDDFIIANKNKMSYKEMSQKIGVSYNQIKYRIECLGCTLPPERDWTHQEKQFLIDNRLNFTINELATILNRTRSSVSTRLFKLKIKKYNQNNISPKNKSKLLGGCDIFSAIDIHEEDGFAITSINNLLRRNGLPVFRLLNIYRLILFRCYNEKYQCFSSYGGRGITVCESWLGIDGMRRFVKWALENGYSDDLTIDRIDNDGKYSPENCRWTDQIQQANNKQDTLYVTAWGETKSAKQWSRDSRCNVDYYTLYRRLKNNKTATSESLISISTSEYRKWKRNTKKENNEQ